MHLSIIAFWAGLVFFQIYVCGVVKCEMERSGMEMGMGMGMCIVVFY